MTLLYSIIREKTVCYRNVCIYIEPHRKLNHVDSFFSDELKDKTRPKYWHGDYKLKDKQKRFEGLYRGTRVIYRDYREGRGLYADSYGAHTILLAEQSCSVCRDTN